MATATLEPTIDRIQSHSVTRDYSRNSEELFPYLKIEVGGVEREVYMEANRYEHSSGWSEWRIFVRDIKPLQGVGEVTRGKIRDACVPVVEAWLASDSYTESRSRAFVWMIRNRIRDERYSADRCEELLREYRHELTGEQLALLSAALDAFRAYLAALEAVNLEAIS